MKILLLLGLLFVNAGVSLAARRIGGGHHQEVADVRRLSQPSLQSNDASRTNGLTQQNTVIRTPRQATLQKNIPEPTNHSAACCQNGGTCVLDSFCMCPANFTGRYCEQSAVTLPCGDVPHNDWMFQGCSLCRCGNGTFVCIEHMRQDCGSSPEISAVSSKDHMNTLSIMDLFDQSRNSSSSAQGLRCTWDATLLFAILATVAAATTLGHTR